MHVRLSENSQSWNMPERRESDRSVPGIVAISLSLILMIPWIVVWQMRLASISKLFDSYSASDWKSDRNTLSKIDWKDDFQE